MGAPRRFDYDEARRLRASGLSRAEVAVILGVSEKSIYRIENPNTARTEQAARDRYYARRRVQCEGGCGTLVLGPKVSFGKRQRPDGRSLCVRCRAAEKTERLLFDAHGSLISVRCVMLDCANGDRWQPPSHFPRGSSLRNVRQGGIHGQCRACQTRARREYRARHPESREAENRRAREARRQVPVS